MDTQQRNVAILIFDGVELLDFAGPFEVFSAARPAPDSPDRLLDVFAVAESDQPVTCRNGLVIQPAYTLANCPPCDILVVPGGQGTRTAIHRPELIRWIAERSRQSALTTSVCTGSFLLARAGLLTGKPVTTHWGSTQRLRDEFPGLEVRENVRWVDAGNIITSAGVSAGIDMALHVLERLYGPAVARATARGIEYDYWEPLDPLPTSPDTGEEFTSPRAGGTAGGPMRPLDPLPTSPDTGEGLTSPRVGGTEGGPTRKDSHDSHP